MQKDPLIFHQRCEFGSYFASRFARSGQRECLSPLLLTPPPFPSSQPPLHGCLSVFHSLSHQLLHLFVLFDSQPPPLVYCNGGGRGFEGGPTESIPSASASFTGSEPPRRSRRSPLLRERAPWPKDLIMLRTQRSGQVSRPGGISPPHSPERIQRDRSDSSGSSFVSSRISF